MNASLRLLLGLVFLTITAISDAVASPLISLSLPAIQRAGMTARTCVFPVLGEIQVFVEPQKVKPPAIPWAPLMGEAKTRELDRILKNVKAYDFKDQIRRWSDFTVIGVVETKGVLKVANPSSGVFEFTTHAIGKYDADSISTYWRTEAVRQIDAPTAQRLNSLNGTRCRFVVRVNSKFSPNNLNYAGLERMLETNKPSKDRFFETAQGFDRPYLAFWAGKNAQILSVQRDDDDENLWIDTISALPSDGNAAGQRVTKGRATAQPPDNSSVRRDAELASLKFELSRWKQRDAEKQTAQLGSQTRPADQATVEASSKTDAERMWGELKNKALMKKRNLDAQIEAEKAIQAAATTELKTTSAQTFQLVDNYLKAGLKDKAKTLLQEIVDVYPNESEPYKRAKQMLSSL